MSVYVGFDIGGTKCACVIGQEENGQMHILSREAFVTPKDQEEAINHLCDLAESMTAGEEILGIGISSGGPMDADKGELCNPPNLPGWHGLSLTKYAEERLHAPAVLENDANACALAEWRYGAGQGSAIMAFLTFGTGLGAGIVIGGKVLRGVSGNAGEVGHWRLADFGPTGYGKMGAFEGFCSGGGIAQLAYTVGLSYAQRGEAPAYWGKEITAKDVALAAKNGDTAALETFDLSAKYLGKGLSLLIDILNPDCIVLGSVYARCEDLFQKEMRRVLAEDTLPGSLSCCRIVPAKLGDSIGDHAALSLAVQAYEQRK